MILSLHTLYKKVIGLNNTKDVILLKYILIPRNVTNITFWYRKKCILNITLKLQIQKVTVLLKLTIFLGGNRYGYLLIISGKTGQELVRVSTPKSAEIYYAPQLFVRFNGENSILFGTGGQNSSGALYLIGLHDIGMKNIVSIFKFVKKMHILLPFMYF